MNGMIRFLRKQRKTDIILLAVALGCLVATAIQYPLSTTFPIGGDAAAHISTVQHLLSRPLYTISRISQSWYPVTYALFSLLAFVPNVSWPDLYTWWMALGQILTGVALGILAYRISNIQGAAIAIGLWALTPITMTSFFEDGTMGQLWSLPWIILFFERLTVRSLGGMALFAFLATFSHPVTGFILLATLMFTTVNLWIDRYHFSKQEAAVRKIFTWITGVSAIVGLYLIATRWKVLLLSSPESSIYMPELFHGFFFPWLLMSIVGWIVFIAEHQKRNRILVTSIGCFFVLSFFLAANDSLGVGFWTNRVNAYALICIVFSAAIGFSKVLGNLKSSFAAASIASLLIIGLTVSVNDTNANIYNRNESKTLYIRIHPEELEAIDWIEKNTSLHAIIFTSAITRHYEWIPVLSNRKWMAVAIEDIANPKYQTIENEKYLVFFTRIEKAPEDIRNNSFRYTHVYKNDGAEIFQMIPIP